MKYDTEILCNSISEKNVECFARLLSNHVLSKANTQVKWCLQLCMQKIQGGHPERSAHLFRCHLHSVTADGITAHSAALRQHQSDI